jgi:hypothetical protein
MNEPPDLDWFQTFVEQNRWRFARTYVKSYPHEYTLDRWCGAEDLARAVDCIERFGVPESFWGTWRRYLHLGEHKDWHMGDAGSDDPKKRPTLINRTWLDITRYRSQAEELGFAGDELDELVKLWQVLLDRAAAGGSSTG